MYIIAEGGVAKRREWEWQSGREREESNQRSLGLKVLDARACAS
jgi:hypothetical protein